MEDSTLKNKVMEPAVSITNPSHSDAEEEACLKNMDKDPYNEDEVSFYLRLL